MNEQAQNTIGGIRALLNNVHLEVVGNFQNFKAQLLAQLDRLVEQDANANKGATLLIESLQRQVADRDHVIKLQQQDLQDFRAKLLPEPQIGDQQKLKLEILAGRSETAKKAITEVTAFIRECGWGIIATHQLSKKLIDGKTVVTSRVLTTDELNALLGEIARFDRLLEERPVHRLLHTHRMTVEAARNYLASCIRPNAETIQLVAQLNELLAGAKDAADLRTVVEEHPLMKQAKARIVAQAAHITELVAEHFSDEAALNDAQRRIDGLVKEVGDAKHISKHHLTVQDQLASALAKQRGYVENIMHLITERDEARANEQREAHQFSLEVAAELQALAEMLGGDST